MSESPVGFNAARRQSACFGYGPMERTNTPYVAPVVVMLRQVDADFRAPSEGTK